MKDVVVFDLDGTIADITHRLHFVQTPKPRWDKFFAECINDKPNKWCHDLAACMAATGHQIVVVSARSRIVLNETEEWFKKYWSDVPHQLNLIRAVNDTSPDHGIKQAWLDSSGLKDRILFVVDDRTRVVEMWRSNGLTCLQCAVWEEYKRPKKPADSHPAK
jgi:hypothetical protein